MPPIQGGFVHSGVMLRVPGDIVFAAGAVLAAVYALRLLRQPAQSVMPPAAMAS